MDTTQLDTIVRSFARGSSRRSVLAVLSAIAIRLATSSAVPEAAAKSRHQHNTNKRKHNKHDKNKKKSRDNGAQPPSEVPPASSPPPPDPVTTADATCAAGVTTALVGSQRFAQSFLALRSGQLTSASVILRGNAQGADFDLEIRDVNGAGQPVGAVLASATIVDVPETNIPDAPRTITGTFASPATVVAGQRYAIVISSGSGFGVHINFGQNQCAEGNLFTDLFATNEFVAFVDHDLVFATFVTA